MNKLRLGPQTGWAHKQAGGWAHKEARAGPTNWLGPQTGWGHKRQSMFCSPAPYTALGPSEGATLAEALWGAQKRIWLLLLLLLFLMMMTMMMMMMMIAFMLCYSPLSSRLTALACDSACRSD